MNRLTVLYQGKEHHYQKKLGNEVLWPSRKSNTLFVFHWYANQVVSGVQTAQWISIRPQNGRKRSNQSGGRPFQVQCQINVIERFTNVRGAMNQNALAFSLHAVISRGDPTWKSQIVHRNWRIFRPGELTRATIQKNVGPESGGGS